MKLVCHGLWLVVVLSACTNLYGNYYVDNLGGRSVAAEPSLVPPTEPPLVYPGGDVGADNAAMQQKGFVQIGYSKFGTVDELTPTRSAELARDVATKKHAAIVLVYSAFTGSQTQTIAYTVDNPTVTTRTSTDANGNTTTHTETQDVYSTENRDVTYDTYEYTATFWVRGKPSVAVAPVAQPAPAPAALPSSLDRTMISAGVQAVKANIVACGDRSPARGQVKVAVKIGADGKVANVTVQQTPDAAIGSCVADALQHATFPRTQHGGAFGYPFVF